MQFFLAPQEHSINPGTNWEVMVFARRAKKNLHKLDGAQIGNPPRMTVLKIHQFVNQNENLVSFQSIVPHLEHIHNPKDDQSINEVVFVLILTLHHPIHPKVHNILI